MASATPVAEIRCEWPDVGQALRRSISGRFVTASDYYRIRTAGFRVRRIATGRPRPSPGSVCVIALAAGRILLRNVYGWFEPTERGVYPSTTWAKRRYSDGPPSDQSDRSSWTQTCRSWARWRGAGLGGQRPLPICKPVMPKGLAAYHQWQPGGRVSDIAQHYAAG